MSILKKPTKAEDKRARRERLAEIEAGATMGRGSLQRVFVPLDVIDVSSIQLRNRESTEKNLLFFLRRITYDSRMKLLKSSKHIRQIKWGKMEIRFQYKVGAKDPISHRVYTSYSTSWGHFAIFDPDDRLALDETLFFFAEMARIVIQNRHFALSEADNEYFKIIDSADTAV